MNKGYVATSQEEAALTIGINRRTFAGWLTEGCPGANKCYVISEVVAWARENKWNEEGSLIEGATGEDGDLKTQLLKEKTEKTRRENEVLRLKIESTKAHLVEIHRIEELFSRIANLLRSGLERLERKYGSDALDLVLEVLDEINQIDFESATTD